MPDTVPYTTTLPLMEAFYTLQGEGSHQGRAAYFIRLAGCDVGCVWCDVKDSWEEEKHPRVSIESIVENAAAHAGRIAVVTGGEPLMQDCTALTDALIEKGFNTHLETSGAWPLSGEWDWICLSPKKFNAPLPEILPLANELKVVIFHPSDFEWAEKYAAQVAPNCKLYLQPEWDKAEKMTPLIVEYIQQHPEWTLSLQVHKYIGVP